MWIFFAIFPFLLITKENGDKIAISKKGWLVYRSGDCLAFYPIRDQSKMPGYDNFLTEEKETGERLNQNQSAPPKLLIAKELKIRTYEFNNAEKRDKFIGIREYMVQPVIYLYTVDKPEADTAMMIDNGWTFEVRGKPVRHPVYFFPNRDGSVYFLNREDSLFSLKQGRRKSIEIYPPH